MSLDGTSTVLYTKNAVTNAYGPRSVMVDVARCESGFRQFNSDGTILRGNVDREDVGVFQINEHYQLDKSKELGINIYTLDGNIEYSKYLYENYGLQPWTASIDCWLPGEKEKMEGTVSPDSQRDMTPLKLS